MEKLVFTGRIDGFFCCLQVPVSAIIQATAVLTKMRYALFPLQAYAREYLIFLRKAIAVKLKYSGPKLSAPKIYNPPDFTANLAILCSSLRAGDFDCLNLINNPIYPRSKVII